MPRDILNDLIAARTPCASENEEEREREKKITAYPLFVDATRGINVADVAVVTGLVSLKDNT